MRYGEIFITFNTVALRPATIGRYLLSSPNQIEAVAYGLPASVFFFYRWSAIANSDYVYVFVMPTSQDSKFISQIQVDPFSQQGYCFLFLKKIFLIILTHNTEIHLQLKLGMLGRLLLL